MNVKHGNFLVHAVYFFRKTRGLCCCLVPFAVVSFVTTPILIYLYFVVFLFPGLNHMKIPRRIDM